MRISLVTLALIMWPLAIGLKAAYWFVGDRTVRHVCKRGERDYSILWPLNPRWHFEMAELGWFSEARAAGYGKALIAIYAGFGLLFAVLLFALYGGFVDTRI
jgi:hypothetical protein